MGRHVDIDQAAVDAMAGDELDAPVVLLNLLKFRDEALPGFGVDGLSGVEAFQCYVGLAAERGVQYEVEPIWRGNGGRTLIGEEEWDLAILAKYPTRRHVIDKVNDPEYQKVAEVRAAALEDSRLIEFTER